MEPTKGAQMNLPDIEAFRKWQQQGRRGVTIDLGSAGDKDEVRVWVYDYDAMAGQHVSSADEIGDLRAVARARLSREIERLAEGAS